MEFDQGQISQLLEQYGHEAIGALIGFIGANVLSRFCKTSIDATAINYMPLTKASQLLDVEGQTPEQLELHVHKALLAILCQTLAPVGVSFISLYITKENSVFGAIAAGLSGVGVNTFVQGARIMWSGLTTPHNGQE